MEIVFAPVQGLPEIQGMKMRKIITFIDHVPEEFKNVNKYIKVYYIKDVDGEKEWTTDIAEEEIILEEGYVKMEMKDLYESGLADPGYGE